MHAPTYMEVQLSSAHLRVAEEVFRQEPISRLPMLAGTLAIAAHRLESMAEVSRAKGAEIARLTKALHDVEHERDRYRAVAQQTRESVAEAEAMLDQWAAKAAERNGE